MNSKYIKLRLIFKQVVRNLKIIYYLRFLLAHT